MKGKLTTALSAALFCGACASSPPPTQELTDAKAAVRAAEAVQADDPDVAYHLKLAREQLALADRHIDNDDMVKARRALERAEADAELALALARENEARARAQAALDDVERARRGL